MKIAYLSSLAAATLVIACSSDGGPAAIRSTNSTSDSTAALVVRPGIDTVTVGDTVRFRASARDSQSVTWTLSDSRVAEIEAEDAASVLVHALHQGTTTVTAAEGGHTASGVLVVMERVRVASVSVSPARDSVAAGDSATFTATPRDAQGNPLTDAVVSWTVADTSVARVIRVMSTSGQTVRIRAVKAGSTTVVATSGGQSGSAELVVTGSPTSPPPTGPVVSVTLTPESATVTQGDTGVLLTVVLRDSGGRVVNTGASWSTADTAVLFLYGCGSCSQDRVLGRAPGTGTVSATANGRTGKARIFVRAAAPVASVTVAPPSATLAVGDNAWFSAELRDAAGNVLTNRSIAWSTSDTTVIMVWEQSGASTQITARQVGSAVLRATSEGKTGEATITVHAAAPVASVTVRPDTATLTVGADTVVFVADLKDAAGNWLTNRAVSWIASDTTVIRLFPAGQRAIVQPRAAGSATLTATSEGKSGSAQVVVTAPPAPGSVALVSVSPASDTLAVGSDSVAFTAMPQDAQGRPVSGQSVTWTVSDSSVVQLTTMTGEKTWIRALKSGSAVLTATSDGKSGSANILVR